MADLKISQLTAATTPLAGTELLAIVQTSTKKITVDNFLAGLASPITTTGLITGAGLVVTSSTIPTNGLYLPAANTVGIATNGVLNFSVSTALVSTPLPLTLGSTTAASTALTILTANANTSAVVFGSASDATGAQVAWNLTATATLTVGTTTGGGVTKIASDTNVTIMTASGAAGAELATFVKDVTIGGQLRVGTYTVDAGATVAGYVTLKDAGGTDRKFMIAS